MSDNGRTVTILALMAASGVVFGFCLGATMERVAYRTEAIEHGYAAHDAKTGEWKWIENDAPQ